MEIQVRNLHANLLNKLWKNGSGFRLR